MQQTLEDKVLFLRAVQDGRADVTDIENPIKKIDLRNIPVLTVADFVDVLICCWYADRFSHLKNEHDLLFEAAIKAGRACKIVDDVTERRWRLAKSIRY